MSKSNQLVSLAYIPDLSSSEQVKYDRLVSTEKAALRPEQAIKQGQWVEDRITLQLAQNPSASRENIAKAYRTAIEDKILEGDFTITLQDGCEVTVDGILNDRKSYHGRRCHDPLEPDYHGDSRIGYINTRAHIPNIYSHAHGGQRYQLRSTKPWVTIVPGSPDLAVAAIIDILKSEQQLFSRGNELVCVTRNGIRRIKPDQLLIEVHKSMNICKPSKKDGNNYPVDLPQNIKGSLHATASNEGFDTLVGLIHHPTLRTDGSVLDQEGYDDSGIYLLYRQNEQDRVSIPDDIKRSDVKDALTRILVPFDKFPFNSKVDRAVFLAAILTATIRRVLPTAPAFAFEASTAASGKTLLAKCLAIFSGVKGVEVRTPCANEEEWKKTLFAAARQGSAFLLYDNFSKTIKGDALNGFLTASRFGGRILGASEESEAPTNMMMVFTGNNLSLVGDINRRVLRCRIDPKTENPEDRVFDLDPYQYCLEHQSELIIDALTIIRGSLTISKKKPVGTTGSFETWDRLVRQPVLWAATLRVAKLGDPNDSFKANAAEDIEKQKLDRILHFWFKELPAQYVTVKVLQQLSYDWSLDKSETLESALLDVARGKHYDLDNKLLSWYLRRSEGRVIDGLKLVRGPEHYGLNTWAVQKVK
jgi:hypothetical protein